MTANKSKTETTLKDHDKNINELLEIVETLKVEVNDVHEKLEKGEIGDAKKSGREEGDNMSKLN